MAALEGIDDRRALCFAAGAVFAAPGRFSLALFSIPIRFFNFAAGDSSKIPALTRGNAAGGAADGRIG